MLTSVPAEVEASSALIDSGSNSESALHLELMERAGRLWLLQRFALGGACVIAVFLRILESSEIVAPLEWWLPLELLLACGMPFAAGTREFAARSSIYRKVASQQSLDAREDPRAAQLALLARNEIYASAFLWLMAIVAALWIGLHGL